MTIASQGQGTGDLDHAVFGPATRGREKPTTRLTRLPRPDIVDDDPWAALSRYRRCVLTVDAAAILAAIALASVIHLEPRPHPTYLVLSAGLPALWLLLICLQRGYEGRFLGTGTEEYRRVANAAVLLFLAAAIGSYELSWGISRAYALLLVLVTLVLSMIGRKFFRTRLYRLRSRGMGLQKVLVVGRADVVVSVIEKLDREPQHGLVAVGACVAPAGVQVSHVYGVPVVGEPGDILEAVDATGAHVVAVASSPDLSGHALRRLSWALEEREVELVVAPGIVEVAGPRLSIRPVAGLSLLHLERPAIRGGKMVVKAAFDRIFGILLLLLTSPVLLSAALAVKFTSTGPVFFRQTRVGARGREFIMLKFRSMVVDAEHRRNDLTALDDGNGMLFKLKRDPRVTRVGRVLRRLSLDELPQLVNVVRGEMSLVGPRPPLPEEVARYSADAIRRLRVRPGLTGLWQVSGRSDLPWEESLQLDLRYVDNWSLMLDLAILWKTVRAVVQGAGAY